MSRFFDLIERIFAGLASRWRNLYLRLRGVHFGGYVIIRRDVEVARNHGDIEIGRGVSLDRGVVLLVVGNSGGNIRLRIGEDTYINRGTMLDAASELVIGRDCAIGPGCYLTDHDHRFVANTPPLQLPLVTRPTRIGNRVWIGARAIVLKGVSIGDDAVIGAGSVVTRDVPSATVAMGVPARVMRDLCLTEAKEWR